MSVRNPVRGASSSWPPFTCAAFALFFVFCIPGNTSAASGVVNSLPNVAAVTAQANELALVGECDRDYSARGDDTNDVAAVEFAALWRVMVREPERHGSSSKSHY